jgi:predicted nucleic acid-binding Zn ribbon protein
LPQYVHKCPECGWKGQVLRRSISEMDNPVICAKCKYQFTGHRIPQVSHFQFAGSGLPSYENDDYYAEDIGEFDPEGDY